MERKKYTFRYGSDIEDLLDKARERFPEFNTLNPLIEHLIRLAVVTLPEEITQLKDERGQHEYEMELVKSSLNSLLIDTGALIYNFEDKERINQNIEEQIAQLKTKTINIKSDNYETD